MGYDLEIKLHPVIPVRPNHPVIPVINAVFLISVVVIGWDTPAAAIADGWSWFLLEQNTATMYKLSPFLVLHGMVLDYQVQSFGTRSIRAWILRWLKDAHYFFNHSTSPGSKSALPWPHQRCRGQPDIWIFRPPNPGAKPFLRNLMLHREVGTVGGAVSLAPRCPDEFSVMGLYFINYNHIWWIDARLPFPQFKSKPLKYWFIMGILSTPPKN